MVVHFLKPNSLAATAGLRPDDWIREIDGTAVASYADAVEKLAALEGDTALIGSDAARVGANDGQGAVYVFRRSGGNWSQVAKLTAADGQAGDGFGNALALSGSSALVGASQAKVIADVRPYADRLPHWLYYRLFDREYFALAIDR